MRSMVEGACHKRYDRSGNRIGVSQDFGRRNPQHPVTVLIQKLIANRIPVWKIATIMRFAIDLDDQGCVAIVEIGHIGADRMLAAELQARLTASQPLPQKDFGQTHRTT